MKEAVVSGQGTCLDIPLKKINIKEPADSNVKQKLMKRNNEYLEFVFHNFN